VPGNRKAAYLAVLVLALLAGFLSGGVLEGRGPSRLVVFSVGQGDCALLQDQGRVALIDAGPVTQDFDAGQRLLAPKLRSLQVDAIDLVLISHPDLDHIGGLPALLEKFSVGAVVIPACFREHHVVVKMLANGALDSTKVHWLERSATLEVGGFRLQLEAPFGVAPDHDNDGSMFVRMSKGAASAVFTGDAGIEVEVGMLQRLGDWRAQILHAGHHGSRTSTGAAWLAAVSPTTVVISCGRNNRYGHPHKSVLDSITEFGARVARTDREGDLTFEVGEAGFERR
jgi:competence protein ComEC